MSSVTSNANKPDFNVVKTNIGVNTDVFQSYEVVCDTLVASNIVAPSTGLELNGLIGINVSATLQAETTIAGAPATNQTVYIGGNNGTTWGVNTSGVKTVNIGTSDGLNLVTVGNSLGTGTINLRSPTNYKASLNTLGGDALVLRADMSGSITLLGGVGAISFGVLPTGCVFDFVVSTESTPTITTPVALTGAIAVVDDTANTCISFVPVLGNNRISLTATQALIGSHLRILYTGSLYIVQGTFYSSAIGLTMFSTVV